jgi:hypothetical protein
MRHVIYSVSYSVVPISSSLLAITLYSSVIKTDIYDRKYSVPFMTTMLDCILFLNRTVTYEGSYRILKIRIWKGKFAVFST